jgi:hypothetical protein
MEKRGVEIQKEGVLMYEWIISIYLLQRNRMVSDIKTNKEIKKRFW